VGSGHKLAIHSDAITIKLSAPSPLTTFMACTGLTARYLRMRLRLCLTTSMKDEINA